MLEESFSSETWIRSRIKIRIRSGIERGSSTPRNLNPNLNLNHNLAWLTMTGRAILRGIDSPFFLLVYTPILRQMLVRIPRQVRDLFQRTQIRRGITMTIQAERHAQRFRVPHLFHLVNLAMAMHTTDAAIHVHRMIEIDVIRHFM